jgi:uncharacterized protein (DUF302 family)
VDTIPDGVLGSDPLAFPFASVVAATESALRLYGFVLPAPLDLQRELRDRAGAYIGPYLVLIAFDPATTHQVLRRAPAAAAGTIMQVVIRGTSDGVIVEVPHPARATEPIVQDAVRGLRKRLAAVIDRLAATAAGSPPVTIKASH